MAEKGFGVKEINLIGASGTPTIESPNNLNLNAVNVAISTNVSIGGTLSVTGNISIGGTLTYEDVTNIDSVGVVTARNGLNVSGGNVTIAKDIDVDGHTNLDNVNISGITTFANNVHAANVFTSYLSSTSGLVAPYADIDDYVDVGSNIKLGNAGVVTATSFSGSGANLTSLPAANLTGTLPAISGANLTGIAVTEAPVTDYTITANGASAYRFHGGGVNETADNPDLYLIRGQKYRFNNTTGSGHPFAIREASGGSAYSNGVTGSQNGIQFFTVPYDAPSKIFYQCTIHGGMVGNIYIRGANGQNDNVGVTTFTSNIVVQANPAEVRIQHAGNSSYSRLISDSDNALNIYTGGGPALAIKIDSSGRVLIGTTTEGFATYGDQFTIANSGHCGMTIRSGTSSYGTIYFSDGDDGSSDEVRGFIDYNHSNNQLQIGSNAATRLRINSSGTITTPHQFHIEVRRSGNQTGYDARSSAGGTPVVFNDVVRTRGTANSALNTSTGKITVPVDGVYFLEASVYTTAGNVLSQGWFTEGSSRMQYSDITEDENTDQVQASGMHYLSANTEVGFHPYGATASSITIEANTFHTWFRVTLIG